MNVSAREIARSGPPNKIRIAVTLGAAAVGWLATPAFVRGLRAAGVVDALPEFIVAASVYRWLSVAAVFWIIVSVEGQSGASAGLTTPRAVDALWLVGVTAGLFLIGPGLVVPLLVVLYLREWRSDRPRLVADVVSVIGILALGAVVLAGYSALPPRAPGRVAEAIGTLPLALGLLVALTAGFTEEFIFRGVVLERVASLTERLWVGIVVSWAFFVVIHIPNVGVAGALRFTAVGALAFTLLYVGTRNTWVVAGLHFVLDLGSVF